MTTNIMHSAQAKSVGGRDGQITSDNDVLNLELTMPKHLGGRAREGATNPEQLFAAGYAACFGNAVIYVARQAKVSAEGITVDATVDLFTDEAKLPTLGVTLHVNLPGLSQEQAEEIVATAHKTCPYSRAVRGNIDVALTVTTTEA
ncbi:organic hydroperoxide resistance protein [Spirosoma sp. KUDC1026]|uniref:organic hydroperoxide resistance protein n=1 Tax=Spirosoma sp. KUDC1026 TaxID=2745947 RepID=UPI00159BAC80|nr:organic hydroperoxide resistance protein [Spirosoma sp. KUDC1026]QKZ11184.1 organic hydroperoxide resistance protein [Spirosoma sp. KUDC1026]